MNNLFESFSTIKNFFHFRKLKIGDFVKANPDPLNVNHPKEIARIIDIRPLKIPDDVFYYNHTAEYFVYDIKFNKNCSGTYSPRYLKSVRLSDSQKMLWILENE